MDQLYFGKLSKINQNFFFSMSNENDFQLFKVENPDFSKNSCNLEAETKLQLGLMIHQHKGYNILEKLGIVKFGEFSIVSLSKFKKELDDIELFQAISSIQGFEKEEVETMKKELKIFHDKCLATISQHGDNACFLIG